MQTVESLAGALRALIGVDHVHTDEATRQLMSQDIWAEGGLAEMVVAPGSTAQLCETLKLIYAAGRMILPRGGGMSYTRGYVADAPGGVVLDLRRMNRILDINTCDMTVRVEAGATWAELLAALKPHGLRTPFWGPLSGISSTIGGGLSQNNALFGAGAYGPSADSVLSLTVVTADGAQVATGSPGQAGGSGFFRHDGPDLTGLFLGDAGAFAIKAEATLRLIKTPEYEDWASFEFTSRETLASAMSALAREGIACEVIGFDPHLAAVRLKRASLLADAKMLARVVSRQKNLIKGVVEGARMAMAGRNFLAKSAYCLHWVVEGRSREGVAADMTRLKQIALTHGGAEIENTIPKVIRATPFTPLNNILGPEGERWAPIHGVVAHSHAHACWTAIEAQFERRRADMDRLGVSHGYMLTTLSTVGFLIEPVFFWPGVRYAIHEATVEPAFLKRLPAHADSPDASALVVALRAAILEVFASHGAAHFQVGRTYPYRATRAPATFALVEGVKTLLDPKRQLNPGALGLE
jgi:FAD/FMN-containing dehydrogenase